MADDTVNDEEKLTILSEPPIETPIENPSVTPETEPKVPEEPAIVDADKVIVEERKEETEQPKPVEEKPVEKVETPPPLTPKPNLEPPATPSAAVFSETKVDKPVVQTPNPEPLKEQPKPEPAKHNPKYTKDIPPKVLELTAEEIDAARKLWTREHLDLARYQANKNRKAHMNEMMERIEKIIKANPQSSIHTIANTVRLSEKLTSGYIEKLVKAGRVKASGNTWKRRYS